MYLSFYDLNEKPFNISTDPKFLWLGEKHKEAFAVLQYGLMDNKGFLLLTGDVGAGKTTLINALMTNLGDDVICATVPDPGLELLEFYRYLAHAFKFDNSFSNKADFIFVFKEFLHNAYENGKKVLLIIDESQRLTNELLEEIRLLSNIELHDAKLLNIFFVGQVEFNTKLLDPANRAVRQRITISNHIQPLTEKETAEYIRHRLKVAGSKKNIFSYVAIHEVHKFSGGYPRLINIVCDIALLTGYVRESQKIGAEIITESVKSLNIEPYTISEADRESEAAALGNTTKGSVEPSAQASGSKSWPRAAIVYLCLLLTIAVGYLILSDKYGDLIGRYLSTKAPDSIKAESEGGPGKSATGSELNADVNKKGMVTGDGAVEPHSDNDKLNGKSENESVDEKSGNVEKDIASAPKYIEVKLPLDDGKLIIDFSHNSNEFPDDAYDLLEKLSQFMKYNHGVSILIIGYTDDLGAYSYNVNLSSFRANMVKSYLIGKGIDRKRIKATGLGPENPRQSNATVEGRKSNRRVEIEILNYHGNE